MKIYPTWLKQKCSWTFSHFFSHAFLSDVSVEVIAAGAVCLRKLVVFYGFDHRGNMGLCKYTTHQSIYNKILVILDI